MPNYAVVNSNNIVINRIFADSLEIAEEATGSTCVLCNGTSKVGDAWDGNSFISPEPIVVDEQVLEEPVEE
jgi:hypothetical protein